MRYQERKYLAIGFLTTLFCAILSWGIAISVLIYPLHHPILNVTIEKTIFIICAELIMIDSLRLMQAFNYRLYPNR